MRARDALIVWTPTDWAGQHNRGEVDVLDTSEGNWDQKGKHRQFYGATDPQWKTAKPFERLQLIFCTFVMILDHGKIEFEQVHCAFLKIDEYRDAMKSRKLVL
jgi:hypothetical protein